MTDHRPIPKRIECAILLAILLLFAGLSTVGITWGLPSRKIDTYLFGDGKPWSGERIYRLAGAEGKFSPRRGADVDFDPVEPQTDEPILLTDTEQDVARIYLRYRLYTHQPDEMIAMMALSGMSPAEFNFDPRLYQYGGLFIYPVGALIRLCALVGWIDVRADVVYYLDHPDEFGKFYVVARAYSAAWGLVGVLVVFAIGRRLGGSRAGLLAGLLFTLMPVVVCMAHEGKPHLPGAVLMLLAVFFAMRHLERSTTQRAGLNPGEPPTRDRWMMCVCCGAAFGTVLSTWPIFVLIPFVAWRGSRRTASQPFRESLPRAAGFSLRDATIDEGASSNNASHGEAPRPSSQYPVALNAPSSNSLRTILKKTVAGVAVAMGVYVVTNPYVPINAVINREVLRSNFGNSLAMYDIARIAQGLVRVLELTVEGATLPILILGLTALAFVLARRKEQTRDRMNAIAALALPAAAFFLQFVLIGAGKPAEYGRFGIFSNTALVIGAACAMGSVWAWIHPFNRRGSAKMIFAFSLPVFVVAWMGMFGGAYLANFRVDATDDNSRTRLARQLAERLDAASSRSEAPLLGVPSEPAPYCCPPLDFARRRLLWVGSHDALERYAGRRPWLLIQPVDSTPPAPDEALQVPFRETGWWGRLLRETPISWANKPFQTGKADPTSGEN